MAGQSMDDSGYQFEECALNCGRCGNKNCMYYDDFLDEEEEDDDVQREVDD